MPTGRASVRGRRRVLSLLLPVLVAPLLAACADDPPVAPDDPTAEAVDGVQRLLRQRARSLLDHDRRVFERTLGRGSPSFLAEQQRYFENLAQLPLRTLRFGLAQETIVRDGDGYWAEVTVRLELQGYDVAPVVTRDRWRFAPTSTGRRFLLTSTTDPAWEADHDVDPQPWDLGPIEVRDAPGVLGIFDEATVLKSGPVLDSVSESRFEVRSVLPADIEDPGGVVVYVLDDPEFVESLEGLPVTDPDRLDGVTVPVPRRSGVEDGPVASYRILLGPHILDESTDVIDRLVRHELTHVALGDRARGVPLWLAEGVAEYVSVRPIAPAARRLQTGALDLVAAGVVDVPSDVEFTGSDAEGWYAVSWWTCEYVAATYGEPALWRLVDRLAAHDDQQMVVYGELGITTSELVRAGIGLMRSTYG